MRQEPSWKKQRLEGIRTAELVTKERERKRQQVLSSLQKFDQSTDLEAYLSSFELFHARRCHSRRRVTSHSPKASFWEDNGSHDGLGFNNTIPIDQVEFTGTFGLYQRKSQVADVDFKAWGQPVTTKFFGTHCQKHSLSETFNGCQKTYHHKKTL